MLRQMVVLRENQDVAVKAFPDYHINETDEPTECEMIQSLNDLKKFREKTNIRKFMMVMI